MSRLSRFGLGGLGGLLPVLATLVAVDLSSIATLIDGNGITQGLCVGYGIRVLGLFALGGIMAAINTEVMSPVALVQIGIAAPALVTSYIAGAEIGRSQPPRSVSSMIISTAHAEQSTSKNDVIVAGGFLGDVVKGIIPGFGEAVDRIHKQTGRPIDIDKQIREPIDPPPGTTLNMPFRVISAGTQFCLDVPPEQVKSRDQYAFLIKSFPPPTFVVEPGVCGK